MDRGEGFVGRHKGWQEYLSVAWHNDMDSVFRNVVSMATNNFAIWERVYVSDHKSASLKSHDTIHHICYAVLVHQCEGRSAKQLMHTDSAGDCHSKGKECGEPLQKARFRWQEPFPSFDLILRDSIPFGGFTFIFKNPGMCMLLLRT